MNRLDFQTLAKLRRREAASLIKSGHYAGGYYLLGYAVECALKACIAKGIERHVFPRRDAQQLYIHDLAKLREFAGLSHEMNLPPNAPLQLNWTIVKDWTEQCRYEPAIGKSAARDMYSACTARTHGVLPWIAQRW